MNTTRRSAEIWAEKALRALAKEDLLYQYHGAICARPDAYKRLGDFFEAYAEMPPNRPADPDSDALRRRPDQEPR